MSKKSKTKPLVGRKRQQALFRELLASDSSSFVALYGRRRVGKTFLVRRALAKNLVLEVTGIRGALLREQLDNFLRALRVNSGGQFPAGAVPQTWQEAFFEFRDWFETLPQDRKHVLFFDELPWLAGRRSRFLAALDHMWNSWGSQQQNLVLIVCGSAASWMIRKIFNDKGGLHNRVTHRIRLLPFDLSESREFLRSRDVRLTDYQILELTMAFGGVPLYLEQARRGESAAQIIDRVCFSPDGFLRTEFDQLYPALFDSPETHMDIVRVLAKKAMGLTRTELLTALKLKSGGRLTSVLRELEESGFVRSIGPFGRYRKETLYQLADEYSLFHLRWIERRRGGGDGTWLSLRGTPRWRAWSGYAFEEICHKHVAQIKTALGLSGIATDISSWRFTPTAEEPDGGQIDLVMDRADACINLCEMKFSEERFVIDKRYAGLLRERRGLFRRVTKTKKNLFLTFVTTHGVRDNIHAKELVDSAVTVDELFAPSED